MDINISLVHGIAKSYSKLLLNVSKNDEVLSYRALPVTLSALWAESPILVLHIKAGSERQVKLD